MKKYISLFMSFALLALLCMTPSFTPVLAAAPQNTVALAAVPAKNTQAAELKYVNLEETQKEILEEVMCDYISEEVVHLMDAGIDYKISSFIERSTYTYVFFEKYMPEGIKYTACGYAQKADGSYAYFEITSSAPLSSETVAQKIAEQFQAPLPASLHIC